ncbi:dihydropteroate synthase [soil metagenome]
MPKPLLMGVLNVTPDSFSDGGLYSSDQAAIDAAKKMIDEGADLIDVGGESTRPGAAPISVEEELSRVINVVLELARAGIHVSIDTSKSKVASACIDAGAMIVNDITAASDLEMIPMISAAGATLCIMHMQGDPRTMQAAPHYEDVVQEVWQFVVERANEARLAGIKDVWIDPGIGFGKTLEQNLTLLRNLDRFTDTDYPVLIGVSRKSFLGRIFEPQLAVADRLEPTIAAQVLAQEMGANIIRAHDVKASRQAIDTTAAILGQ